MSIILGGETFDVTDFVGDDGLGHAEVLPALTTRGAEARFPNRIFARFLEDLAIVQQVLANSSFVGTSTTSLAIGTGSKTFVTQSGKGWVPGMLVIASDNAAPHTNSMYGTVTSYSGTSLVINVPSGGTAGSGTIADWSIAPKQGVMDGPTSSTDYALAVFNGTSGKVLRQISSILADASDNLTFTDKLIKRAVLSDCAENVQAITSTTTTTIDIESGNVIDLTHNANITTLTLSNPSPTGKACWLHIMRTKDNNGTARTITWPASVKWPGGTPPVLTQTANAFDFVSLVTKDGGTTWYGFPGGLNLA